MAVENKQHDLSNVLSLTDDVINCYKSESAKLPFHLNLIDELHAGENAHSRILVKLLQYTHDNKYIILESFIDNFYNSENQNFTHKIIKPKITAEKMRIDALIRDSVSNYGIIIENKIHNADDRKDQINSYIKKLTDDKISIENIYIVYLTRRGGSPSKESFSPENMNTFAKRYIELSYSRDIISWLKDIILPDIKSYNELFLQSALEQYIDHLEGMFHLREREEKMNKEIIELITKNLELEKETGYKNREDKIKKYLKNIETTREYLEHTLKINYLESWHSELDEKYTCHKIFDKTSYPKIAIKFEYNEVEFAAVIQFASSTLDCYYGLSTHLTDTDNKQDIVCSFVENNLSNLFKDKKRKIHSKWYVKNDTKISNIFNKYENLIKTLNACDNCQIKK